MKACFLDFAFPGIANVHCVFTGRFEGAAPCGKHFFGPDRAGQKSWQRANTLWHGLCRVAWQIWRKRIRFMAMNCLSSQLPPVLSPLTFQRPMA